MVQISCGATGTGVHRKKIKFSSGTHYYAVLSRQLSNIFYELNKFERGFSRTVKDSTV